MGWIGLATVLLKIVKHFMDNKTPDSKRQYVKNLEGMAKALVERDVHTVNNILDELREAAREGDEDGFGIEATPGRELSGDPSVGKRVQ